MTEYFVTKLEIQSKIVYGVIDLFDSPVDIERKSFLLYIQKTDKFKFKIIYLIKTLSKIYKR